MNTSWSFGGVEHRLPAFPKGKTTRVRQFPQVRMCPCLNDLENRMDLKVGVDPAPIFCASNKKGVVLTCGG